MHVVTLALVKAVAFHYAGPANLSKACTNCIDGFVMNASRIFRNAQRRLKLSEYGLTY